MSLRFFTNTKIGELIIHSVSAAAQVEMVDRGSGEYRVVLQGMLDLEDPESGR